MKTLREQIIEILAEELPMQFPAHQFKAVDRILSLLPQQPSISEERIEEVFEKYSKDLSHDTRGDMNLGDFKAALKELTHPDSHVEFSTDEKFEGNGKSSYMNTGWKPGEPVPNTPVVAEGDHYIEVNYDDHKPEDWSGTIYFYKVYNRESSKNREVWVWRKGEF